jgi:hypothetical protein
LGSVASDVDAIGVDAAVDGGAESSDNAFTSCGGVYGRRGVFGLSVTRSWVVGDMAQSYVVVSGCCDVPHLKLN